MRNGLIVLLLAAPVLAAPVLAQVPPAEIGQRNVPAPWWMQQPVIASTGMVRTELPANRATFSVRYKAIDKSAERALAAAGEKVRGIDAALRKIGADRLRLTTNFSTQPLYEQYRDKDGNLVDNERPDKVERYAATVTVAIEVRDLAVLEPAYNAVVASLPDALESVDFSLQPDNVTKTWLQTEAVKDAAKRARQAVEAAGGRLGPVKVIDPTGGVCNTEVLAGWPSYSGNSASPTDVNGMMARDSAAPAPAMEIMVAGARNAAVSPPVVSLQPPLRALNDSACVVYGLLP
ncbi:MAG: SIMPL domain-containing protein [Alphaproteobacteria bacterium PA4]|nr:MAG: SIMPL domain-containing protein [Alphaproteobacteria bacterium PA4]